MSMTPLYTLFPALAARETRTMRVGIPNYPVPMGEYGFIELYCNDKHCDCRQVVLQVVNSTAPKEPLAIINFGWETAEFYTRRAHGDKQAVRDITKASLDPLNPQSRHASFFLDFFQRHVMTDPEYVARLARHYEMFKATQVELKEPARPEAPSSSEATPPPFTSVPEILRQLHGGIATRGLAHVKANPGHRLEEIGKAMRRATSELKRPIANLMARQQTVQS